MVFKSVCLFIVFIHHHYVKYLNLSWVIKVLVPNGEFYLLLQMSQSHFQAFLLEMEAEYIEFPYHEAV